MKLICLGCYRPHKIKNMEGKVLSTNPTTKETKVIGFICANQVARYRRMKNASLARSQKSS